MRTPLLIIGILALLIGAVWIGQGSGAFPYPASSFMVRQVAWIYYGGALAMLGIILIAMSRRAR